MLPPRRRSSLRLLTLGGGALLAVLTTGVAVAATLGVSSTKLTTSTGATSIAPATCTLNTSSADSYAAQDAATTNFGTDTEVHVTSRSGSQNRRAFVRFNLSSCSIPSNSLITLASLKLFLSSAPSANRTHDVHLVTGAWTETGLTWNNQPTVAGSATASFATGTTDNVRLTANVTSDVQAFVDGTTNNGWRVKDQVESSATERRARYRAREIATASERPILEVTYYP